MIIVGLKSQKKNSNFSFDVLYSCDHHDNEIYLYDNNDDDDEGMKGKKIMISLCALLIVYTVVPSSYPTHLCNTVRQYKC